MGDPRPDSVREVVAGLVIRQVHHRPELPSVDQRHAATIPAPRTFENRDVGSAPTRSQPESPGPT